MKKARPSLAAASDSCMGTPRVTGVVTNIVIAQDSQGPFTKALLRGQLKPVCVRGDIDLPQFVNHLSQQGLLVPANAVVRKPLLGESETLGALRMGEEHHSSDFPMDGFTVPYDQAYSSPPTSPSP